MRYSTGHFEPADAIEAGTRVCAANGWHDNGRERPALVGTVTQRKREGERWVHVRWDEPGLVMPQETQVPCYSLMQAPK